MTSVGWSTLDVIPSAKNFRAQLEAQTSRDFATAGRKGGQQFGDAAGREAGSRFKSRFSPILKDAVAPIAGVFAGAAVVDFFKGAIQGASDLAESGNKVRVIFGDATDEVDRFASQGAKRFGQTKLEVLNAASSFGVFGKAAGLTGSDLADFSDKLAGLSTDLASFFNTDPSQAVEALGAGLRGESEPLRNFGVLLDDATLRQEALRLGLIATTKNALTPQQRVLAAYHVILKQTKDAHGDFERTSGGLANQQRILSAQWSEMRTELGSKLLPATTKFVNFLNDDGLPVLEATGGVVADSVRFFSGLPTPIKAATGALVAFRAAQSLGAGGLLSGAGSLVTRGLDDIRLRAMLVSDEYQRLRQGQLDIIQGSGKFTPAAGRVASALGAIEVGAIGAGRGLKAGLSGALGIVGGPWGAAFIAGTAVVAHFWAEHQKAKQKVADFTATLDAETGAMTDNSRAFITKQLLDSGALAAAQRLGLSLETVTNAALGQKDAWQAVSTEMRSRGQLDSQSADDAIKVKDAITGANDVIRKGASDHKLLAAAQKTSTAAAAGNVTATGQVTQATESYTTQLDKARAAVQKLLDKENERRNQNLSSFQDQTRIAQALADARKEAAEGKRTLDANSEAGRKNRDSLAQLADAWNSSTEKVKNAKGAYRDMRQNFINVAEKMGATDGQAKRLANRLLGLPRRRSVDIDTPGMDKALADLRDLRRLTHFASERIIISAQGAKNRAALADIRRAGGGPIAGPGTGTSDSVLMWGSNGEFMQRKAAVDYYGVDFMHRLNNLEVPRYANGGAVGVATQAAGGSSVVGHEIVGLLRWDADGQMGLRAVIRDEIAANDSRRVGHQRGAGIGGPPV